MPGDLENLYEQAEDGVNDFVRDPQRMGAAVLTLGASEAFRFMGNEAMLAAERSLPEGPEMEKPGAAPTSNDASVRAAAAAEAARNRRGRASTMLMGQGKSLTSGSLSRRTLLGE